MMYKLKIRNHQENFIKVFMKLVSKSKVSFNKGNFECHDFFDSHNNGYDKFGIKKNQR